MKYFWINCEQHVQRRTRMEHMFNEKQIENYRVDAFVPKIKNKVNFERACTTSHLLAISKFLLETNDEFAVICEDDLTFEFDKYWHMSVDDIPLHAPSDFGIIQLACILQSIEQKFNDKEMFFKYSTCQTSGTLAYLITREAASSILKSNLHVDKRALPRADCFRRGLYTMTTTYTLKFPMFVYPNDNDSTIGNSIPLHVSSKKQQIQYHEKNKPSNP